VRLKHPIKGALPFRFDLGKSPIREGTEMIQISAETDQPPPHPPAMVTDTIKLNGQSYSFDHFREPIVQRCRAIHVRPADANYATAIYSDCAGKPGQSGSILLVRIGGELLIKGVHKGGGEESADYTPFKMGGDPKDKSYSFAIGIDSYLLDEIQTFVANDHDGSLAGSGSIIFNGLRVVNITPSLRSQYKIAPDIKGVVIAEVPNDFFVRFGWGAQVGVVITAVSKVGEVTNLVDLQSRLQTLRASGQNMIYLAVRNVDGSTDVRGIELR
jgi:hypothetical protein